MSQIAQRAFHEAQTAQDLACGGNLAAARQHYSEAIRLQPGEVQFHWLAALCDWQLGDVLAAGESLRDAVRVNPSFGPAQASLGHWYLIQGLVDAALQASAKSIELIPDNAEAIESRAWILEAAGELDAAWELVRQLIARGLCNPSLVRLYGRMAPRFGQAEAALAQINRVLEGNGISPLDHSGLHCKAAAILEGMGRYNEAFAHATLANSARKVRYDPLAQQRVFDRFIDYFTCNRVRSINATFRCDKPVFIVGMPRSGTSLVEQILATHPKIHGGGELDFMYQVYRGILGMIKASESVFPECLGNLNVDQADGMAQIYLKPLLDMAPDAARITDKMPLNFFHLGLIAMILPEARIIHCRRDPLDTCLSCYMTNFNVGHEFKYNLRHLGLFYRQYERLMAHWREVVDIPILDVSYEDVVADPAGQSRRMIDFLGLPWDEGCLNFHNTRRAVATASVEQVRRPIYKTSVQRWRHYEQHLAPLRAALELGRIDTPNASN